jgi:NADH-quinone oxidoreductase subunit A
MDQYLPLLVLLILATLFAGLSFVASSLLGPRRQPNAAKDAPYECGIIPDREPAERFPVRFYLVAMIFIIIDIEIIFLYPWAVIFRRDLGTYGLWEMLAFGVVVFLSFVYLLGRGALNWGPQKRLVPVATALEEARSPQRSTESTIRRVGEVGRLPAAAGVRGPNAVARSGQDRGGH